MCFWYIILWMLDLVFQTLLLLLLLLLFFSIINIFWLTKHAPLSYTVVFFFLSLFIHFFSFLFAYELKNTFFSADFSQINKRIEQRFYELNKPIKIIIWWIFITWNPKKFSESFEFYLKNNVLNIFPLELLLRHNHCFHVAPFFPTVNVNWSRC